MAHTDEAFSNVTYVKGQYFLMFLEERFGRDKFDAFLKNYFDHFAFQSIITEDFIKYLHDELHVQNPDALTKAELREWIYEPGLPATAKKPVSDAFKNVTAQQSAWLAGTIAAAEIKTDAWSTHEWLHFLNTLPDGLTQKQFAELDAAYNFTGIQNAETAFAWYMNTIKGHYAPANDALENFLMTVGRGKFIYRLYGAMAQDKTKREWAKTVYAAARPGYNPIAQRRIDAIFAEE